MYENYASTGFQLQQVPNSIKMCQPEPRVFFSLAWHSPWYNVNNDTLAGSFSGTCCPITTSGLQSISPYWAAYALELSCLELSLFHYFSLLGSFIHLLSACSYRTFRKVNFRTNYDSDLDKYVEQGICAKHTHRSLYLLINIINWDHLLNLFPSLFILFSLKRKIWHCHGRSAVLNGSSWITSCSHIHYQIVGRACNQSGRGITGPFRTADQPWCQIFHSCALSQELQNADINKYLQRTGEKNLCYHYRVDWYHGIRVQCL